MTMIVVTPDKAEAPAQSSFVAAVFGFDNSPCFDLPASKAAAHLRTG